jgi:hypothetical protein
MWCENNDCGVIIAIAWTVFLNREQHTFIRAFFYRLCHNTIYPDKLTDEVVLCSRPLPATEAPRNAKGKKKSDPDNCLFFISAITAYMHTLI